MKKNFPERDMFVFGILIIWGNQKKLRSARDIRAGFS